MSLFARGVGGFCSDAANAKSGMRGRLWCQVILLLIEGCLVIAFSFTRGLAATIIVMLILSIFVQAAEGSTFGIVPYIGNNQITGSIAGLVGAGGNIGGISFSIMCLYFPSYRNAFMWMGCAVLASALWTLFMEIRGHRALLTGEDCPEVAAHRRRAKLPSLVTVDLTVSV
jgi:NNP family nitrate/nitrite transporter-like MFS transporter